VRDAILDSEGDIDMREIIAEGEYYGMQTFDQALYRALIAGKIDIETALRVSSRPHDLKLLVSAEGHLSTSMEHLDDRVRMSDARSTDSPGAPPDGTSADESDPDAETSNGAHAELIASAPSAPSRIAESFGPPREAG
jgi:twitching motility protein PilT